jgi:hypothetical protein
MMPSPADVPDMLIVNFVKKVADHSVRVHHQDRMYR